jgi:hypothetical protein
VGQDEIFDNCVKEEEKTTAEEDDANDTTNDNYDPVESK